MTSSSNPNPGGKAGSHRPDHAALVHEARKTIKRMRALARLLRDELGEQELDHVNKSLRDAAQRLARARDAEVRLATLQHLRARHPKALALEGIEQLRTRLERERDEAGEPAPEHDVLSDIGDMRRALSRWNLVDHDFEAIAPGLRRIYRGGRRRYARVIREHARDAEAVHDWRKRVKSLYYALDMLGGTSAKGTQGATRRAERLGDLLGEEHDLWLLSAYVEEHPDAFGDDAAASKTLLALTERRRKRLRERALGVGARLYELRPGDFIRRVRDSLAR
ncbi:MAG TPA: CHAD domain-containing protein [Solirubrobacteraceae bacterium]|nr:CHAD domain-containing protein [Solirubrobacteraceae bacterium]